jgi:senataxin
MPPERRKIKAINTEGIMAIAESLCCDALLRDEGLLAKYFDEPFKMVQGKRGLGIRQYIPATTKFLFDSNTDRCKWAQQRWHEFDRSPTKIEFDWAMKDALIDNLKRASAPNVTANQVQRLWFGLQLIMDNLDKDRITHSLRALDQDFCQILMQHFHIQTAGLRFMLHTFRILLEKASSVFWEAMGPISPVTVIEQIFTNPQYNDFLLRVKENEMFEDSALKDMLGWIDPFVSSLPSANQPQACRSLANELLNLRQDNRFPNLARSHCYCTGVTALQRMAQRFSESTPPSSLSVARATFSEIQEIVGIYAKSLLDPPGYVPKLNQPGEDRLPSNLEVVSKSLELECSCLKTDFEILQKNNSLEHPMIACSPKIWSAVASRMQVVQDTALAQGALIAFIPLVGLETFRSRGDLNSSKSQFNQTFGLFTAFECQILEQIADFSPEHIDDLLKPSHTATPLISSLFSVDQNVSQTVVELIKNITGQPGRKEAINHLVMAFFATAINAFNFSYRRFAKLPTFSCAPLMIRTGKDLVDELCDPQRGILRIRSLKDERETAAIMNLWSYLWGALGLIFKMTEQWTTEGTGLDKQANMNFCRDTMQLAELLFESYDAFAGALNAARSLSENSSQSGDSKEMTLLQYPAFTLRFLVYWLRFRDEYLAATSVKLVLLILRRLGEFGLKVDSNTLSSIENISLKDSSGKERTKTMLTPQQKAELCRALDTYLGRTPGSRDAEGRIKPPKQSTLTAWTKSASTNDMASESSVQEISDEFGDSEILDEDILELSRSLDVAQAQDAARKRDSLKHSKVALPKRPKKDDLEMLSFREKRQKENAEKKKRDALEIARQKKNQALLAVAERISGPSLQGKDFKGDDNLMVSESSDSDVESATIFGPTIRKNDNGTKGSITDRALARQGPIKKVKQVRSAKDMRARLAPDLSSLHKTILSWDFFSERDVPPSSNQDDYSLVSSVFRTPADYQRTFEPLLILEAWQGFRKDKEEGNFKAFMIKVSNRLNVDAFIEVSTSMPVKEAQELQLGESDVVLISKSKSPVTDSTQPHCLARISRVAKRQGTMQISYRVNAANPLLPSLSPNTDLWGAKISSLTPLEREYGALLALQYYDLCDEIIKAKPSPILEYSDKALEQLVSNYQVNQAQAKAVRSALDNDAFTLIQGPPGSGKTKTIVALVGALLTNSLGDRGLAISRPSGINGPSGKSFAKKLLVCAPSNAAVDEIVMRLKQGVKTLNGRNEKLSIVRLGRSDAINSSVKDVTLDELVQAKMKSTPENKPRTTLDIMMEHKAASEKANEIRGQIDELRSKGQPIKPEMDREFELLKRKKNHLSTEIDASRDKDNTSVRDSELNRRRIQQEILDGAHVLCATLSGSGHDMFQHLSIEFETVIIDEAAQSIELSALIPLKYGCSKCILVGDPKQLPPTVLSREAAKFQYEQSLFVRMQANHPNDVHLLDTQYRMHPEISRFPSKAFYDSRLRDGQDMAKLRTRPWHQSDVLGPYRFFDVQGTQQASRGHSLINIAEVHVALQLYGRLIKDCRGYDFNGKIGIITPYKSQLRELKMRFSDTYGKDILTTVDFNTTDAFQGRESEIIIFSCVRASTGGIGFLADIRRMNVGLTRAKCSLWVLGNSASLGRGEFWNGLVQDSRARNLFTSGDILGLLKRPLLTLDVEMTDAPPQAPMPISHRPSSTNPSPIEKPHLTTSSRRSSTATTPRDSPMEEAKKVPAGPRVQIGTSLEKELNKLPAASAKMQIDPGKAAPADKKFANRPPEQAPRIERPTQNGTRPNGPSGGPWMTNDNAMCSTCGSAAHHSHECDNALARAASGKSCLRCKGPGHSTLECTAERCLDCGEFGHPSGNCKSTNKLTLPAKDKLRKTEASFAEKKKSRLEIQRQKQLGEHDQKVPVVRPTDTAPTANHKRKREVSPPRNAPKGPKVQVDAVSIKVLVVLRAWLTRYSRERPHPSGITRQ